MSFRMTPLKPVGKGFPFNIPLKCDFLNPIGEGGHLLIMEIECYFRIMGFPGLLG